jgi:hypothetical protein
VKETELAPGAGADLLSKAWVDAVGQKVQANGSVSVVVQKPGPDTNVRTSTAINLFKDVVLRRGRTMAPADG